MRTWSWRDWLKQPFTGVGTTGRNWYTCNGGQIHIVVGGDFILPNLFSFAKSEMSVTPSEPEWPQFWFAQNVNGIYSTVCCSTNRISYECSEIKYMNVIQVVNIPYTSISFYITQKSIKIDTWISEQLSYHKKFNWYILWQIHFLPNELEKCSKKKIKLHKTLNCHLHRSQLRLSRWQWLQELWWAQCARHYWREPRILIHTRPERCTIQTSNVPVRSLWKTWSRLLEK